MCWTSRTMSCGERLQIASSSRSSKSPSAQTIVTSNVSWEDEVAEPSLVGCGISVGAREGGGFLAGRLLRDCAAALEKDILLA